MSTSTVLSAATPEGRAALRAALPNVLETSKIRAWLAGKKPRSRVGVPRNGAACPLHTYLADQGIEQIVVGSADIRTALGIRLIHNDAEMILFGLPRELRAFVLEIDHRPWSTRTITAQRALRLLDSCTQEGEIAPR